ncbi:MAG: alpha-isopropylmalate synthase regulatory domain-containing protein [Candidatus Rariloculaceae bacterium]
MSTVGQTRISIMDTTLRDGEQTPDIAYTASEKLHVARMLLADLEVDRIEIASARVSSGELEAAQRVTEWASEAGLIDRVEMLGFCDGKRSVDWIRQAGGRAMNLLAKGSEHHCRNHLQMTPEQHIERIADTVAYARENGVRVSVYLEDWSNGVRDSFEYVTSLVNAIQQLDVERVYLADTLGILAPEDVRHYISVMTVTWPDIGFEFHGHNDYGLATANAMAAIQAGASGVHVSVNGLGERAGNTSLAEIVAAIADHTECVTGVNESRLAMISNLVETFSGKKVSANSPILGNDVFTQTAGVHADGDAKGDLYATRLAPQRFGRERRYALGKLSGKASLDHNLERLGITLTEENRQKVLDRIIELGDKKHTVAPEDLLMIIADVLKTPAEHVVRIENYSISVASAGEPNATVSVSFRGETAEASSTGDGGYDAFMRALKEAVAQYGIVVPRLADYRVRIPPGGRTEALVETLISWGDDAEGHSFSTIGVDSDQTAAAVIATEKMLNIIAHEESMTDEFRALSR